MDYLVIFSTEHKKERIGSANDGGYVIAEGLKYDLFISCGISDDITFEDNFVKKYNINCIAFDGTINNLPHENENICFIKKNIANNTTEKTTDLTTEIEPFNNIFLKMDIETNEYQWIEKMTSEQLNKFNQIVVEFHFPFTYEEQLFMNLSYPMDVDKKIDCLKKLNETHYLIHLHANNCCGTITYNNIEVPNVFECTYLRKDFVKQLKFNTNSIPDPILDRKNVIQNQEIVLSGYPYNV
jgi:hypothetical protein